MKTGTASTFRVRLHDCSSATSQCCQKEECSYSGLRKTKDTGNVTLYGKYNELLSSFIGKQVVGSKTCDVGMQCEIIGSDLQRTSTPEPKSMSDTDTNTTMEMESEFEDPELPRSLSLGGRQ